MKYINYRIIQLIYHFAYFNGIITFSKLFNSTVYSTVAYGGMSNSGFPMFLNAYLLLILSLDFSPLLKLSKAFSTPSITPQSSPSPRENCTSLSSNIFPLYVPTRCTKKEKKF